MTENPYLVSVSFSVGGRTADLRQYHKFLRAITLWLVHVRDLKVYFLPFDFGRKCSKKFDFNTGVFSDLAPALESIGKTLFSKMSVIFFCWKKPGFLRFAQFDF